MKKTIITLLLILLATYAFAQFKCNDILQFGNMKSEAKHALNSRQSEVYKGGLNETARRMLPKEVPSYDGGTLAFRMKVDPVKQNYFTVRCFGSEKDKSMLMLFSEGKQVGYRHLGDIDLLSLGNGEASFVGRYYYVTLPIPLKHTKGKKNVNLEIRSYGEIWGYGETFERYQKNMVEPTLGIYKAYTHTEPCFVSDKDEKQGVVPELKIRKTPGVEVLGALKNRVNNELNDIMAKTTPLSQLEMWFLTDAYSVTWTPAYQNGNVASQIIFSIDDFYKRFLNDSSLVYSDKQVYNNEWLITGPISRAIRKLWKQLEPLADRTFDNGKGQLITHRKAWAELMQASLKYSTTHRRRYTNQSMIIDMFMYDCNKALALLDPKNALPEYQTLKYLHESIGLTPWLGRETPNGPEKPLGDNYLQLTHKGLTKEIGFVGYYGEVLDWVVDIYKSTCVPSFPSTGDAQIREQLIKMMRARSYFRYPSQDEDGNRAMRIEAVVGWRDASHYPGNITYGDRAIAWDATPLMTAAITLDSCAVGMAQQMINDNQFFNMVDKKLEMKGIRVTKSLLHIPDEYELIMKQKPVKFQLPMTKGMPDFVFSDEEDGVIAVKNGDEILYASLYWRARNAVNNLAKVHYITPTIDRIANLYIETDFEDSGLRYVRPNWVNLAFSSGREWYKGINSAHEGDILPIAKIPDGIKYKIGDENSYAGKCNFYRMQYGNYVVGMNCTKDKTYQLSLPASDKQLFNLSDNKKLVKENSIKVAPMSTVVLYVVK